MVRFYHIREFRNKIGEKKMSKKMNPAIRRKKAAELLEQAKKEKAKRFKELGELFSKTYLSNNSKSANVSLEDFKAKAEKILHRNSKKTPSPGQLQAMADEMVKKAEQEEAQRKQRIGEHVLDMLNKMQELKPGTAVDPQKLAQINAAHLKQIKAVTEQIWQQ
jgi:hypothetical protein